MKFYSSYIKIGKCDIDRSVIIHKGSIIGKPFRRLLDGSQEDETTTITKIGSKTYIGYYSIVGSGSIIGADNIIDDRITIESSVKIGSSNLFTYGAQICNDVVIGDRCVIGGFIGERTKIGNDCRIFGKIVHSQYNPSLGWDDENAMEPAVTILDSVFVGFNAVLAGNIKLGPKVYICAGAIVTKNVPSNYIVKGFNEFIHYSKIISPLKTSSFFNDGNN